MRSPETQGEDGDHGTSVFHALPLVGLIWIGGEACSATPEQFGPRNCGQLSLPNAINEVANSAITLNANKFIGPVGFFMSFIAEVRSGWSKREACQPVKPENRDDKILMLLQQ